MIAVLRAGAALLVVYSYLVALWLRHHGADPQPIAGIREWLNRPLRTGEDFGPFALMVLLLCTGWTTAAARTTGRDLLRTALPVLVAAPLASAALTIGLDVWTYSPGLGLVPLAWVVGLQLVAALVGLDRRGWPVPVALLGGVGLVVAFDVEALGKPALFLTMVLVGHAARRVGDGVLPGWVGLTLGAGCFAAVALLDGTVTGLHQWWYPVTATYAVLVFLAAVAVPVPDRPVIRWLADRAEWLLVLSGVVGFAVLGLLHLRVPLSAAILCALAATALAADAGHRMTGRLTGRWV